MNPLAFFVIFAVVLAGMEAFAWATHRYVMHGWGWGWHASHHAPREGMFERNDLYAVVFAVPAIALFWIGVNRWSPALPMGLGVTAYGLIYLIFHDGLVHRRFPFLKSPKSGYLKRLVQAHRIHHAVHAKDGCVSFGFLYAPPVRVLKAKLRQGA